MSRTAVALVLATGVLTSSAMAQQTRTTLTTGTLTAPSEQPKTSFVLSVGGTWISEADFDDVEGDLSIVRLRAGVAARHKLSESVALRFGLSAEHSNYDFNDATGLVDGTDDPFDDVLIARLAAGFDYNFDENNTLFVTGFISSSGEGGADFSETITGGGVVGYSHRFGEKLSLGVGVVVSSRLEDSVQVIPVPIIRWQFAEKWLLQTGDDAMIQLLYTPSEMWRVGIEGGWEQREFRLEDDGPLPSGVVTDSRIPVGLIGRYSPNKNFSIVGRVGLHVGSSLEFDNERGREVSDEDLESSVYGGLELVLRF